jgi:signal transduction histidine kinase
MALLRDFAELLTTPPGSLAYRVIAVFATQILLGIGISYWRRQRGSPIAVRLLATTGGMAFAQVLLIVVALLDWAGVLWGIAVLPPLERFLDFAILFLVIWAFLPILREYQRLGNTLLLVGLLAGAGMYVASAFLWLSRVAEGSYFNHYWQSSVWELLNIAVIIPTMIVAALRTRHDWGLITCVLAVWLAGHALEFAVPIVDTNAAGWVRLANLIALPLLTSLVYREALRAPPAPDRDLPLELVTALSAVCRIEQGSSRENALGLVASAIAHALESDVVALGITRPGRSDRLRVVAIYPPRNGMAGNQGISLSASDYPRLADVLRYTAQPERIHAPPVDPLDTALPEPGQRIGTDPLSSPQADAAATNLFRRLGFDRAGPLLVQPLEDRDTTFGAILVGNPSSQRTWTARDEQILDAVGTGVAAALTLAFRRQGTNRDAELRQALDRERSTAERAAALQSQLDEQSQRIGALGVGPERETVISLVQELRTPMTSISGYTELLLDEAAGILGEMQHQFLQRIHTNVERVDALLDELLDVAAAGARGVAATRTVDIGATVDEAIRSLSTEFDERDLIVQREVPPQLPPVEADADSVSQIVRNLLSNACYASKPGTGIVVRVQRKGSDGRAGPPRESLLVSVTDTGGGISPDDQRRVFSRLYRAENRPIPGVGDTGVGLSVAKTLVEAQGGRVWVESVMGTGSTFSVVLPVSAKASPEASGNGAAETVA